MASMHKGSAALVAAMLMVGHASAQDLLIIRNQSANAIEVIIKASSRPMSHVHRRLILPSTSLQVELVSNDLFDVWVVDHKWRVFGMPSSDLRGMYSTYSKSRSADLHARMLYRGFYYTVVGLVAGRMRPRLAYSHLAKPLETSVFAMAVSGSTIEVCYSPRHD